MQESNQTTRPENEQRTGRGESPNEVFHGLTAFERDILTVLAGLRSPAGVDIRAELTAYYETRVEESRLYQALTNFGDQHLVEISAQDGRTNAYQLTTHGERVLVAGRAFKATVGCEGDD